MGFVEFQHFCQLENLNDDLDLPVGSACVEGLATREQTQEIGCVCVRNHPVFGGAVD